MSKLRFQKWCTQTWPEIYRYSYYRVRNREEAEDVTQETFARVFSQESFKGCSSADLTAEFPSLNYLKVTALNIIRDRWRRRKARGNEVGLEEILLSEDEDLQRLLDKAVLEEILQKLTEDQQMVLRLRIIEGYSRAETARKMAKSEAAVRGLQYRAIQNLRVLFLESLKEGNESENQS